MSLERVAIFGATSAIAQATARLLAKRGARLHLVARDAAKLEAVRADLAARGAAAVTTALADLDDPQHHAAMVDAAIEALGGLDAALVAQGILPDPARAAGDPAIARQALHTNFVAPALLLGVLAERFESRGAGTLAAISSVAGDRGRASNYVYGSAKAALSTYLAGLRNRLHAQGVKVVTIKPGFVDTPMTAHFRKGALWASPARVAEGIVRAMERGTAVAYVPWFWWPIMLAIRMIPEAIFVRLKL
jgi:decaprenylphospho-beta-D-erythro-pentofuranosid-2-ulose 2-reductase